MNLLFSRWNLITHNRSNLRLRQSFRATVALGLVLTLFLTTLSFSVSAHEDLGLSQIENDNYVFYVDEKGKVVCREATPAESRAMENAAPKDLRPINHHDFGNMEAQPAKTHESANAETHLTIILNATPRLEANTAARDAFNRAARAWESRISSPITIYIQADLGPTFFDSTTNFPNGVLGQTGGAGTVNAFSYNVVRDRLLASANTSAKAAVYNALPSNSIPTDLGAASSVAVSRTLARAIGLLDPIAQPNDSPPRIGFNSAFNFDFDSTNGISVGQFDFEAVATHEIGHALGFTSRAGQGSPLPAMWDLYRFRGGTTTDTFTTAQRILTIGGPQLLSQFYFVPGEKELGLSDGGPDGVTTNNADGNQSSHWRGMEWFPFLPIGIMEPSIPPGVHREISDNDTKALDVFGYNSITVTPPPNDNLANAQTIAGCSGSVTGTNVGATREPGEPVHSTGSSHSVWYQWQAPTNSSVTITTAGSDYDTVLGVYEGGSLGALSTIVQNDDVDPGNIRTSTVTFNASAGVVYRIAVDGFNNQNSSGDVGSIQLNWNVANCSNVWLPTVLNANQVEMKSWTISGVTSVYVKLTFPDAGFRVANWALPVSAQNAWSVDAIVERFNGPSAQVITNTAQIYNLGAIPAGQYTFSFKNSGTTVKTLNFTVSTGTPPANPIDDPREFVRWQYKDFLRREPDGPGLDHWTAEITQCSDPTKRFPGETEALCVSRKRANTSAAFFMSPEFLSTGYFVLRVYRGSLARMPHFGGGNTAADEFTRDAGTVSAGIVVNNQLSPSVINANKQAFVNEFVTRAEFRGIYDGLNNTQYVDKLFQTTGVTPTTSERQTLIDGLGNSSETRASVLFKVVDGTVTINDQGHLRFDTPYGKAFYDNQFNAAFVEMEYFGYLLRDPDDAGRTFWLDKLNTFGNWVDAQMVLAFITSPEYRSRFGAP